MIILNRLLLLLILSGLVSWTWPFTNYNNTEEFGTNAWLNKQISIIRAQANDINNDVIKLSLKAFVNAKKQGVLQNKQLLTIIDYSKPSTEKRLWVFDLSNGRKLFHTWVSHGKNSGGLNATSFSNQFGSLKSSIGVFVTEAPYVGGNGYSLRLNGLEAGINDNAYKRSVVIHGAWYVNPATIAKYGQIGRSWGCPAVDTQTATALINTIKSKTLVFAYYPDRQWLSHSRFLSA